MAEESLQLEWPDLSEVTITNKSAAEIEVAVKAEMDVEMETAAEADSQLQLEHEASMMLRQGQVNTEISVPQDYVDALRTLRRLGPKIAVSRPPLYTKVHGSMRLLVEILLEDLHLDHMAGI